ncbi:hypothetical protein [Chitinophaga japonensis]|uniref:Uncharacterized protein n=1 Tax=Chitinophaga japonensis TaxID=104662 RepID=A0A562T4F9_CHIJA|nr:hypothetical protein [Chitinophaga japonensis]TWI87946.1 hypothetical protein LX66_2020 [Chitinophaga japonensis]
MTYIQSQITLIDEKITKGYPAPAVDFNDPNWTEKLSVIELAYREKVKEELLHIKQAINEYLEKEHYRNIPEVACYIRTTRKLNGYLIPTIDEIAADHKNLLLALALFIMRDLMPDARDELVYFNNLMQECRKHKIDYAPYIKKLLPLAGDKVRFGNYSVKSVFESAPYLCAS